MKKGKSINGMMVKQVKQAQPVRRKIPQRICVICRAVGDKGNLIRLVRRPDGDIVVDETGRMSGRGAYICYQTACWQGIATQLGRALKTPVSAEMQERLLTKGKEIAASRQ